MTNDAGLVRGPQADPGPSAAGGSKRRPRVLVLGGGFAGLNAALELSRHPLDVTLDVTLIDRRNHHTFQPLLYQVALAVLSPADIAQPIRSILAGRKNVEVLMDEALSLDPAARQVFLRSGAQIGYDYLILATGATHSYFGHDGWAESAPGLKTVEDAIEIRRRVLLAFELAEREMAETGVHPELNFVIVGGGATGVELAGAIAETSKMFLRRNFRRIDPSKAKVVLLEGGPRILAAYPPDLSQKAARELGRLGVAVRTAVHVTDVQPGYVVAGGVRMNAVVTLWAAGVRASPLGAALQTPLDNRGCVPVNFHLNPAGHPEIFVCGDLAHVEENGRQLPGVAQPAMQMGRYAARTIAGDLAGRPRSNFHYFDKGDMATIGRRSAVADVKWPFRAHLSGWPGWITWLAVHLYFLVGFRNRIAVVSEWAWTYLTFNRGARLITGSLELPGWEEQPGARRAAHDPADRRPQPTALGPSAGRGDVNNRP